MWPANRPTAQPGSRTVRRDCRANLVAERIPLRWLSLTGEGLAIQVNRRLSIHFQGWANHLHPVAADEGAHTAEDAAVRIQQGYSAISVKAIAKTLSMTMKITQLAYEKSVPCFCADLTVNPILVDWNKNVAARLPPFPGVTVGLQETNGHQYFKNRNTLMSYHPKAGATWTQTQQGVYPTDSSFYTESGGILLPSPHYE